LKIFEYTSQPEDELSIEEKFKNEDRNDVFYRTNNTKHRFSKWGDIKTGAYDLSATIGERPK
jgi:hypothetical protein